MNRSLLSAFEERNLPLVDGVRAHLAGFAADAVLHARFLNMLSLLEHVGSRKIMTCRAMRAPGLELLKHLTEESRHAFFFKRAAEALAGRALDYGPADTIAPAGAKFYMERLDAEITGTLGDAATELPYLYMSLIVELRATWLGGTRILDRLESRGFDVFKSLPALGAWDAVLIGTRMVFWRK